MKAGKNERREEESKKRRKERDIRNLPTDKVFEFIGIVDCDFVGGGLFPDGNTIVSFSAGRFFFSESRLGRRSFCFSERRLMYF